MRGEKESTRKTFAAKLAVSGKERTWITGNRRATGPSNIHAFGALAGFFPAVVMSGGLAHVEEMRGGWSKAPLSRNRPPTRKQCIDIQDAESDLSMAR
jgi:hypothetical protein